MGLREDVIRLRAELPSQAAVAEKLGISQSRVSQLLRGTDGHRSRKPVAASSRAASSQSGPDLGELREQVKAELKAAFRPRWDALVAERDAALARMAELEDELAEARQAIARLERGRAEPGPLQAAYVPQGDGWDLEGLPGPPSGAWCWRAARRVSGRPGACREQALTRAVPGQFSQPGPGLPPAPGTS